MGLLSESRRLDAIVSRLEVSGLEELRLFHFEGFLDAQRPVDPGELPALVGVALDEGRIRSLGSRVLRGLRRFAYLFLWPQ